MPDGSQDEETEEEEPWDGLRWVEEEEGAVVVERQRDFERERRLRMDLLRMPGGGCSRLDVRARRSCWEVTRRVAVVVVVVREEEGGGFLPGEWEVREEVERW